MIYGRIYKITNKINSKAYIGQTIQDISKRFKQHATDKRSGRHLYATISKHGIDNFEVEEIFTVMTNQNDLDWFETYFIEKRLGGRNRKTGPVISPIGRRNPPIGRTARCVRVFLFV